MYREVRPVVRHGVVTLRTAAAALVLVAGLGGAGGYLLGESDGADHLREAQPHMGHVSFAQKDPSGREVWEIIEKRGEPPKFCNQPQHPGDRPGGRCD